MAIKFVAGAGGTVGNLELCVIVELVIVDGAGRDDVLRKIPLWCQ